MERYYTQLKFGFEIVTSTDYRYESRTRPLFRFASTKPTLDFGLEITKSRKFVIQGFIWITKFWPQVPTSLQAKMAQHSKQMRVGASKGSPYHSLIQ